MNKIKQFFVNNKYVAIWTVCYFTAVWAILRILFGFNFLLVNHWVRLSHLYLHGFPAFVFGILLLAAVPLYVATTTIIARTKKPLFTIPMPKWAQKKSETVIEEEVKEEKTEPEQPLPENLPTELREPFLRARAHMSLGGAQSVFNKIGPDTVGAAPDPTPVEPDLPLPPDFDVETDFSDDANEFGNKPLVFSDVDFDDNNDDESQDEEKSNIVFDYLTSHDYGDDCVNMGDMVVCRDYAIVWHDDTDLWIADEGDTWYGPGKQELSPVLRVKAFSNKAGTKPVLYLATANILNIDTLRKQWSDDGITVIDDLGELDKLLNQSK